MARSLATPKRASFSVIAVTSMMLFSMFFGAGNLIFPPMLGVQAGENFVPAIAGFITTGVLLPALAVIAIALSGNDMRALTMRGGKIFGLIFPVLVYLSIGVFYALPRTAAVSFSTIITPNFGWDGIGARILFSLAFFVIALALSFEPSGIVDKLGKYLTPLLLILLVLLIAIAAFNFQSGANHAQKTYVDSPFVTGFVEGYLTMDSLAGLAFGIMCVNAVREKGITGKAEVVKAIILSAVVACMILGGIYLGLGVLGNGTLNGAGFADGAILLATVSGQLMGPAGAVVFGLIVFLACMSTAVGLMGSAAEYFNATVPKISYKVWLVIISAVGFLVSISSLETILAIAGPIIGLLYPSAITLIFLAILQNFVARRLDMTFKLALIVSMIWALLMCLDSLGWGSAVIAPMISWAPGYQEQLSWTLPTLVAAGIGAAIDFSRKAPMAKSENHDEALASAN